MTEGEKTISINKKNHVKRSHERISPLLDSPCQLYRTEFPHHRWLFIPYIQSFNFFYLSDSSLQQLSSLQQFSMASLTHERNRNKNFVTVSDEKNKICVIIVSKSTNNECKLCFEIWAE